MQPGRSCLKASRIYSPDIAMSQCSTRQIIGVFTISLVDAGTADLIRGLGKNIVSSGDLVAQFEATWTEEQINTHFAARDSVDAITAAAFKEIGASSQRWHRRVRNAAVDSGSVSLRKPGDQRRSRGRGECQ